MNITRLKNALRGLLDFLSEYPHPLATDINGYEEEARAALADSLPTGPIPKGRYLIHQGDGPARRSGGLSAKGKKAIQDAQRKRWAEQKKKQRAEAKKKGNG